MPASELTVDSKSLRDFLRIGIQIATILERIHDSRSVLGFVSPEIVSLKNGVITSAPNLSRAKKGDRHSPDDFVVDDPQWLTPELTGRIGREVDSRSDLYAAGNLLYTILAKSPVFSAKTPLEWVHAHIALRPRPLRDLVANLPQVVSDIVELLLMKAPEDRYQTASALRSDLERCLRDLENRDETIRSFPIAQLDQLASIRKPRSVVGRDREIKKIRSQIESLETSSSGVVLVVGGYSGIGKSALYEAATHGLSNPRLLIGRGKAEESKRHTPLFTVSQVIEQILRQILESSVKMGPVLDELEARLSKDVKLLQRICPTFELILKDSPTESDFSPREIELRTRNAVLNFFQTLSSNNLSLSILIDDLQWIDDVSLQFLEHLVSEIDRLKIHLTLTFRTNELSESHAAYRLIRAHSDHLIDLGPLNLSSIETAVSEMLGRPCKDLPELSALIERKTEGNPFFIRVFLEHLRSIGALFLSGSPAIWNWSNTMLEAIPVTENLSHTLVKRIKELQASTQLLCAHCACIGSSFSSEELALTSGLTSTDLWKGLSELVQNGLISGSIVSDSEHIHFHFAHDRVYEAALAILSPQRILEEHLRIARHTTRGTLAKAKHYQLAAALLSDPKERAHAFEICAIAATDSLKINAYQEALTSATTALSLIDHLHSNDRVALLLIKAESEFLLGGFDSALATIAAALEKTSDRSTIVRLYRTKMNILEATGSFKGALEAGVEAVRLLERSIPFNDPSAMQSAIKDEYETFERLRADTSLQDHIKTLKPMSDPESLLLMSVYAEMVINGFFSEDFLAFTLICNRMVNLTLSQGLARESLYGFALFAPIPRLFYNNYDRSIELSRVVEHLLDSERTIAFESRIRLLFPTWSSYWYRPIRETLFHYRLGLQVGLATSDPIWACYNAITETRYAFYGNQGLGPVLESTSRYSALSKELNQQVMVTYADLTQSALGRLADESQMDRWIAQRAEGLKFFEDIKYLHGVGAIQTLNGYVDLILGDIPAMQASFSLASPHVQNIALGVDFQIFTLLSTLNASITRDETTLLSGLKTLEHWAQLCPAQISSKLAFARGFDAIQKDKTHEAGIFFQEAANEAKKYENFGELGLALEWLSKVDVSQSAVLIEKAKTAYFNWGAHFKARTLDTLGSPNLWAGKSSSATIDLETILSSTQALSKETQLPKLIEKLLRLSCLNAGADRAVFFEIRDGSPQAVQEFDPNRGLLVGADGIQVPTGPIQFCMRSHQLFHDVEHSVLAIPMMRRERLESILYLENRTLSGAFSGNNLEVLKILTSQMMISIENARLYRAMEDEVEARTQELALAQKKLIESAKLAALGEMAGGIAHEINNPLTIIYGNLRRIERTANPEQEKSIRTIEATIERITAIVSSLLDFSKKRPDSELAKHSVVEVIQSSLALCRERLRSSPIKLSEEYSIEGSPEVRCNPVEISQILINLLNNAIDALTLTPNTHPRIRVGYDHPKRGRVEIWIEDNGPGIAEENIDRIFEPFFSTKSDVSGVGLGLSVSSGLAKKNGGDLTVRSEAGKTRFTLTLSY